MEVFIFIGAIGVVILLGRYAIAEGQRKSKKIHEKHGYI